MREAETLRDRSSAALIKGRRNDRWPNVKTFSGGNTGLLMDLIATACIQAAYNLTVLPEAPPQPSASASSSPPRGKSPPRKAAP